MQFFTTIIIISFIVTFVQAQDVSVWLTTTDSVNLLSRKSNVTFSDCDVGQPVVVDVDSSVRFQVMDGFGASLTESSAYLIAEKMSESQRTDLLNKFFSKTDGIGLNFLRQPIGSSDFALGHYTYDDTCCDLSDFSIDRDRKYVIPLLKKIQAINDDILILGTPWSPPAWMKTSNNMTGGSLKLEYYGELASYFVKYVQEYQKEGIPIHYVTPQNEPVFVLDILPSMYMSAQEETNFIKNNLGPLFVSNGISTKILIYDFNWSETNYSLQVLRDFKANGYIEGSSFHCYRGKPEDQMVVHNAYPTKGIWVTECSSRALTTNSSSNPFQSLFTAIMKDLIIGSIRNWSRSVIKWNLALDENFGPHYDGCDDCYGLVEINQQTGNVTYSADYYGLGHASKFVDKGARRIQSDSNSGELMTVAFLNPNGSIALITFNNETSDMSFKVKWNKKSFAFNIPGNSAATFVWEDV